MRFRSGAAKNIFSNVNRVVDEAIGGWRIAAAGVGYTGFPETISGPGKQLQQLRQLAAQPISSAEDRGPQH